MQQWRVEGGGVVGITSECEAIQASVHWGIRLHGYKGGASCDSRRSRRGRDDSSTEN